MPFDPIPLPLGGFDDREALLIDGKRSPNLQNIRLRRERITKRPGIALVQPDNGARVSAMAGFDSLSAEPLVQLLSFPASGNSIGKYDFDTQAWTPLAMPPSGEGALNGFQHWSVVNTLNVVVWTASGHVLRVYAPVPAALNPVLPPLPPFGDARVLPTDLPFITLAAMVLIAFGNRVIAVRTEEGGLLYPTRVRWHANGQLQLWNPGVTDGAGFLDVRETTNMPLTGAFVLNSQAWLTKANEIIEFVSTGDSTKPFVAQSRIRGRGFVAPHAFGVADYAVYGLGADNVYSWDGSTLTAIGDPIWETLSSAIFFDRPDTGHLQRIVGAFYRRRNEYWLYAPDQVDKNGNPVNEPAIFIYDTKADRWYIDRLTPGLMPTWFTPVLPLDVSASQPIMSARPREQMTTMTDNQSDSSYYWFGDGDEYRGAATPPTPTDMQIQSVGPPANIAIDSFIETKDYEPQEFNRGQAAATLQKLNSLYEVRFQSSPGARVEVWMSPDQARNWVKEEVVVNEYGVGVAYFLNTFSTLRLRFRALSSHPLDLHGMVQLQWQPSGWNPSLA